MRMMSSRQFCGLTGWKVALLAVSVLLKLEAVFCINAYTLAMACPLGVMHWGDITLATIVHPAGTFGGVLSVTPFNPVKFPISSAEVGRVRFCANAAMRSFFHSWPAKKNSLPRLIGPPNEYPKSLNRRGGLITLSGAPGAAFNLDAALAASKISLRTYSNRLPWKSFPPLLVTTFTDAASFRPYSAE